MSGDRILVLIAKFLIWTSVATAIQLALATVIVQGVRGDHWQVPSTVQVGMFLFGMLVGVLRIFEAIS